MIDLHCHILPGIDDGAVDLDDSLAMARLAAEDGVHYICATPHIRHDHDVKVREIRGRVIYLNAAIQREFIPVTVFGGGEVAETAIDGLDDDDLRRASLGGSGAWVLVEPRPGPIGESLQAAVGTLDDCGIGSVIAHPERHFGPDTIAHLKRLVQGGALVQVTAAALLSPGTAPAVMDLVGRGLVHVRGGDSHSATLGRPPTLSQAYARLRQFDVAHADWIAYEAPDAIVRGAPIEPPFSPAQ